MHNNKYLNRTIGCHYLAMSSPSSDIHQNSTSESDIIEVFKKLLKDHEEASEVYASHMTLLKDLESKREHCLKQIEEIKQKQIKLRLELMNFTKGKISQNSEKKFTNIYDMTHAIKLNVEFLYHTDSALKGKEWKSNRFINHLCTTYQVFQCLEDNTYKIASLEEAENYWRNYCGNKPY